MLHVFSHYVVGWMAAYGESATFAERFIDETCARQGIGRDHLTIHGGGWDRDRAKRFSRHDVATRMQVQ